MKLIILDRDGVINKDSEHYIKSADEWILIPKSADAIALLNQYDYTVAIATNQSGLSRGLFSMHDLNQMHSKMLKLIQKSGGKIAGIWFCPHTDSERCKCRKPKTGMLEDIFKRFNIAPDDTYFVGDSLRDLECIDKMNGKPVLVLTGKGKKTLSTESLPANTVIFDDLWSFANYLCSQKT